MFARPQNWLGDAMDDASMDDAATDPLLQQLHQLALLIVDLRGEVNAILSNVSNADSVIDFDQLTALTQEMAYYVSLFKQVAAQRTAQNPYALGWVDQAILDTGTWAQQVLAALPGALAAIPNALIKALGSMASAAGQQVASSLFWPAVIGVGAIVLVTQAEKTRTYRKYAA